jgi:hypothetical protein
MPGVESLCFLYTIETQLAISNRRFLQGINTTYQSFVNTFQKLQPVFRFKQPAHAQIHYITATFTFQLTQPQKL